MFLDFSIAVTTARRNTVVTLGLGNTPCGGNSDRHRAETLDEGKVHQPRFVDSVPNPEYLAVILFDENITAE